MYPSSPLLRRRCLSLSLRRRFEDAPTLQLGSPPWASKSPLSCSKHCFLRHFSSAHGMIESTISNQGTGLTIGILRETYDKWERRAPLCPHHVQELIYKHGLDRLSFLVQPSSNRAFTNEEYFKAGATIVEDLSTADVILGVKRPRSMESLTPRTTHLFFSHVIKGQPGSMPLLQEVLNKHIPLIDYECIVFNQDDVTPLSDQEQGQQKQRQSIGFASGSGGMQSTKSCEERRQKRLVAFGKYAGIAGMVDTFQALGRRLLWNPVTSWSTPFLNCPPAILHQNLAEVQRSVGLLGGRIATEGLPPDLEPLVFTMTGKGGNVHSGVRQIFDGLPHEMVSVEDLPQLFREHQQGVWTPRHKVYGVELGTADIYQKTKKTCQISVVDAATAEFDRSDFRDNPSDYESTFARRVAPFTHVLLNCIYWDQRFPRLLTKQDVKELYETGNER
jgi:alpha-aminoadipic semialdehyde synthase